MICLIPFLLYGLLLISDTASQSLLDECVNETLTISESCTAHPDQPDVFKSLSAALTKDIAILSLDIWNLNQSSPLYVFEAVMSDYGENVLRMKSYLKFLSIAIKGDNITRRSILFVDEPDGCISKAVQNDTDKTKTKIRDWILCGFTHIGSDESTTLLIQELCSQSSELHTETYLGDFFNNYLYVCCYESQLNQKCINLKKDHTLIGLLDILGKYSSGISVFVLFVVAMYYFEYRVWQWKIFCKDTDNVVIHESELVNPNNLSLLAMISPSFKSSIMHGKWLMWLPLLLVCFSFILAFISIFSISILLEQYISSLDIVLLRCVPSVIIPHIIFAFGAAKKNKRVYRHWTELIKAYVERIFLMHYYLFGYIILAGSFRLLTIQFLSFMVNTQDNYMKIAGSYCAFLLPFNYQYVKALRKEYTDYLKLCMKTIIKERQNVNVYHHKPGKAMSKSRSTFRKQLFCLKNNEYAIHIEAFVELCHLKIVPCPGAIWWHGIVCFLKYLFVDVFVYLILSGLYEFGKVYAASDAVVHVISIITVLSLLRGEITVFEKTEKFDGNETDTETKIIETFSNCKVECECIRNENLDLEQENSDHLMQQENNLLINKPNIRVYSL